MQRQSSPLGSSRTQNTLLPIIRLKTLGSNSFPPSGATHGGPGAWRLCQDGEMDKTVPRVSLLLHRRNLAGTLLQGGGRLVPSPPGETTAPPPRLSSTLPSPEKFHFNHSTLVQYSILRLRNASDKNRFPFKQTGKTES